MINRILFLSEKPNAGMQLLLAFLFPFFTIVALGIDSVLFAERYFDGRQITNVLSIAYFLIFFFASDSYLRKLMFTMVFLSYLGEIIFCKLLGMYHYRNDAIPLYVPFGHAIVYASGYVFAHTKWAFENERILKKYFVIGFSLLFVLVGILLNDVFSLISGVLFFLLLKRKKWQNLYFFIALCVVFIELAGTYFQCWKWVPKIFGSVPTVNPPMGAVFYYSGGDVLLVKMVALWKNKKLKQIIPS
ncbi:hypothetical protein [Flavobacterium palustre]|uniref:hypothetical protein n=1 Tax=Flavobacterium palustre TaxID=1476463 RepID=UPI0016673890|nr:hypothetical protein [Flavobacterium palustre]